MAKEDSAVTGKPEDITASKPAAEPAGGYLKMNYSENQFLRAKDFQDEQAYHERKQRDHNRILHEFGVCDGGLIVTKNTGKEFQGFVDVSPGYAIDMQGNQILLAETESVNLTGSQKTAAGDYVEKVTLYIRYGTEVSTDHLMKEGGFTGYTRMTEKPRFGIWPTNGGEIPAKEWVLLAFIQRDVKTGAIVKCDGDMNTPGRPNAGVKLKLVETRDIAKGAVTSDKIAENAITTWNMANASVNEGAIQTGAVTTGKIADGAVTKEKISGGAVTSDMLAADRTSGSKNAAVGTDNLQDFAVTSKKLGKYNNDGSGNPAVGTLNIQNGAVTSDKLLSDITKGAPNAAVGTEHIKDGAVTSSKLREDTTSGAKSAAVATSNIQDGAVTSDKLQKYSGTSSPGAVATENLQQGAVTSDKLQKYSVGVSPGAVGPDNIRDGAVKSRNIPNGEIPLRKLQFNNIVSDEICQSSLSANRSTNFTVTRLEEDYLVKYPYWVSVWARSEGATLEWWCQSKKVGDAISIDIYISNISNKSVEFQVALFVVY